VMYQGGGAGEVKQILKIRNIIIWKLYCFASFWFSIEKIAYDSGLLKDSINTEVVTQDRTRSP
jgi:hypothetical protein